MKNQNKKIMSKLGNNSKTVKSLKYGYENLILHFSPLKKAFNILKNHKKQVKHLAKKRLNYKLSKSHELLIKNFNSCPYSGVCATYCLDTSGRGKFSTVQIARAAKTIHYIIDKENFDIELKQEITRNIKRVKKNGLKLAIRLNGTSDINFTYIYDEFKTVNFYDYTKNINLFKQFMKGLLPNNYYMTFSYDKLNHKKIKGYEKFMLELLEQGHKIAIIESDLQEIIKNNPSFKNYSTIDGDKHDLRFLDKKIKNGAFVSLKLKKTVKQK
jgi:hypothetical protein